MADIRNHIAHTETHQLTVTGASTDLRMLIGALVLGCLILVLSGCASNFSGTRRFTNESLQNPDQNRPPSESQENGFRVSTPTRSGDVPDQPPPLPLHDTRDALSNPPETSHRDQYGDKTDIPRVISAEWLTQKAKDDFGEFAGEAVGFVTSIPIVRAVLYVASILIEPLFSNCMGPAPFSDL